MDLWACEAAIALKSEYPHLKCSILTAFRNPEEQWSDEKKDYYEQILREIDYYAAVSNQPYQGRWQFAARDELLFRKTDGILLVYDDEAAEGSPKYINERALKLHTETGYSYYRIGAEEIQNVANEDNESQLYE